MRRRGSVYMLGAAGGHNDYAGNEVDAIELYAEAPRWVQLREPTPNSQVLNEVQFYSDGRPASTHTYSATQYIERLDRMVVFASPGLGGSFPSPPADSPYFGSKRSFSFNYALQDWDTPDYLAHFPGSGDFASCLCVKHPYTDDVYYSRNYGDGWYRWTSTANRWDKLSTASRGPWYVGAAIDPTRNRMLIVSGYSAMAPEVRALDGQGLKVSFGGLGAAALTISARPSVVYDEANDAFIVAFNSGSFIKVLRVDAGTLSVSDPAPTGTPPSARMNGLQNAMQYAPELKGVVLANQHGGNMYFMRTA